MTAVPAPSQPGPAAPFPAPSAASARSAKEVVRLAVLRAAGLGYPRRANTSAPRSVLLIRPDHLGDVLLMTPALHAFRAALPHAQITALVGPWGADIVRGNPDLDAVETCAFPGFARDTRWGRLAPYRLLGEVARRLCAAEYDAAVILRFDHWWGAWLAAAAGIPRRVGYSWPETQPFLTEAIPYRPGRHEAEQNATLLAALAPGSDSTLGPTRFQISDADRAWVAQRLASLGSGPEVRLIAIHPGAGAAVKQWPVAAWVAVADRLAARPGVQIVLTGGRGERSLTADIAARLASPAVDLAGQTTLGQLAALYARTALVLGADSGPLHLAVAAGAATVQLYGPISPAKFGPWGDPARNIVLRTNWPCAPCDRLYWSPSALPQHACMAAITPEEVLAAAGTLIGLTQ